MPLKYKLFQNYPNPFNSSTEIHYNLSEFNKVNICVVNILGEEIITLVNENKNAGDHIVIWNGIDSDGNIAPSGVYIYRFEVNDYMTYKKMILLQ